jgi:hypothetical protein
MLPITSKSDNRHYRWMAERVLEFESGKISLKHLVDDMDALLKV